jgi:hypothetical protein
MSIKAKITVGACWLWLWVPTVAFSGHGFVSAFTNIEWLPEPGRTPDSAWYRLDGWREEGQLWLARATEEKARLCLTFAREKLAELEAMVKAEKGPAAEIAAEQYQLYLERAKHLIQDSVSEKESVSESMAAALLEHQYILSVIYTELPRGARAVVLRVMTDAHEDYQEVIRQLSPKKKGSFFFKEEEVRWSVQMAARADEEDPQQ